MPIDLMLGMRILEKQTDRLTDSQMYILATLQGYAMEEAGRIYADRPEEFCQLIMEAESPIEVEIDDLSDKARAVFMLMEAINAGLGDNPVIKTYSDSFGLTAFREQYRTDLNP